jgi:hypothetical protein
MIPQIIAFIDLNEQMTPGLNRKSAANIYSNVSQPGFRGTLGFRGPLSRFPRPPSTVTFSLECSNNRPLCHYF